MASRLDGDNASIIFGVASGIRHYVGIKKNKTEYVPHLVVFLNNTHYKCQYIPNITSLH